MNRFVFKKLILITFMLLSWNWNYAQSGISFDYKEKYKEVILQRMRVLKSALENGNSLSQAYIQDFNQFDVFPLSKLVLKNDADTNNIKYYADSVNSVVISPSPATGQLFDFNISTQNVGLLGSIRTPLYLDAINKFGDRKLFFTYFLDMDSALNNTVAVYNERSGDISFWGKKNDSLIGIGGMIRLKYGSITDFKEMRSRQDTLASYRREAFSYNHGKDEDSIIRQGWLFWVKYLPTDTLNGINHLVSDLAGQFHLPKKVKKNLIAACKGALHAKTVMPGDLQDIYYLNADITPLLKIILTPEQYTAYYRKWQIDKIRYIYVSDYIFFKKEENVKEHRTINDVGKAYDLRMQNILLGKQTP